MLYYLLIMKIQRFIFTGGGTGGHVYPNIAIYEAVKEKYPEAECLYIGTRNGVEGPIVQSIPHPIPFVAVPSKGIPQNVRSLAIVPAIFAILRGTLKSLFILHRFKPDIIIASGGYVAAPALLAAALLKKKVFIHEQNSIPGRLNRLLARYATRIGVTYPFTLNYFPKEKALVTGYPLRRTIAPKEAEAIKRKFNIPLTNKVVFICSGSTGSRSINRAAAQIIPDLLTHADLTTIISTGKAYSTLYRAYDDFTALLQKKGIRGEIEGKLIIREYFDHIDEIYSIADLVISRAGAGAIEELKTLGLPSILIPKINLPGDHQILNAKEIEKIGGCRIIPETFQQQHNRTDVVVSELTLRQTIIETVFDPGRLALMKENLRKIKKFNSIERIIRVIDDIIEKKEKISQREIKVFYLQAENEEKNHELIFQSTTLGHSILADIFLENMGPDILFEIKFLPKDERMILRRIKGTIHLNDQEITRVAELHEGDRISIQERIFHFKSYKEKLKQVDYEKSYARKVMGSSFGILLSRIGGFIREVFTAAIFGAGKAMDIFSVGLTLSNFMRRIVAENALENAFLPIFLRIFHRGSRKKTWEAAASITNFTLLLALVSAALGIVFAPLIIKILFPGFITKGFHTDTVIMTRLMFPYLLLVTIAAVMATYLKAFNQFGIAESSTIFFSIGTVLGIFLFMPLVGQFSLALGILLGGFLQILFLLVFLIKILKNKALEFSYPVKIKLASTTNKKYYFQLTPISIDVLLSQAASVVDKFLASSLRTGSLSFLYYSMEIFRLPFAIISQAISSVVLKEFSENIALFQREKAKKLFVDGIKINLFLLTPISILMIALARPIVSLLLERFNFNAQAVTNTAFALQFYSVGLVGWGIHTLTTRIFSARIDIKTSMVLNFFMLGTNIILCLTLVKTPLRFAGIALATSLSFLLFALIRIVVLKAKLRREEIPVTFSEILGSASKTALASILMVIGIIEAKFIFNRLHFSSRTLENLILIISLSFIGVSIYLLSSLMLKNADILLFQRKFSRQTPMVPVPSLSPFRFLELAQKKPSEYASEYGYKINQFLASRHWEIRNIGIKLIGIFKERNRINTLIDILQSSKENSLIRRNAMIALNGLQPWDEKTGILIEKLLNDRYFEVRVAAINYLTASMPENEANRYLPSIDRKLKEGLIEEKLAALRFIGQKGGREVRERLRPFYLSSNSLIREEVVEALRLFYQRNLIGAEDLKKELNHILITSNHLVPDFRIKSQISRIYKEIGHK